METKIILEVNDEGSSVHFEPALDAETFVAHVNSALNTMPNALMNIFANVPLLRPASEREREAHIYVFNEGEQGEVENRLYKYRKHLYDATGAVFSQLLTTAFPDIEYIEGCKAYQQDYCMNVEAAEEYKKTVEEVTAYVREHFDEIIKEVEGDESDVQG